MYMSSPVEPLSRRPARNASFMSSVSASPSFEMASTWLPFGRASCTMSCSAIACAYAVVTAGSVSGICAVSACRSSAASFGK